MARVVIAREHDETAAVKPPRQRRRTEADWEQMADQYLATGCEGLTAEPAVQF